MTQHDPPCTGAGSVAATIGGMHTLITHASPFAPLCRQACATLQLPNLTALLRLLTAGERRLDPQDTLSPLHETLEAQILGFPDQDGLLPWAALQARQLDLSEAPNAAWAWLTPCHWQVNADHVRMAAPADTQISDEESATLMETMRGFFAEDGITLHGLQGGNWLACGEVFRDLPTASLARASGGSVDHWIARAAQAAPLRRLQNEMQMLTYSDPVNDARTAQRLLPVNSFWISGTGSLPPDYAAPTGVTIRHELRTPTAQDDAKAWLDAWQTLDEQAIRPLLDQARNGTAVSLTLCGEQAAQTFTLQPRGLLTRLTGHFAKPDVSALLQTL